MAVKMFTLFLVNGWHACLLVRTFIKHGCMVSCLICFFLFHVNSMNQFLSSNQTLVAAMWGLFIFYNPIRCEN